LQLFPYYAQHNQHKPKGDHSIFIASVNVLLLDSGLSRLSRLQLCINYTAQ